MKHSICLQLAAALLVAAALPLEAQAQTQYPTLNIRVIVPSPTGGPSDIVARLLGDKLGASLGKQMVVDNRVGASHIQKRFADMGLVVKHSTPEAFGKFLAAEINRWRALLAKKP